MKQEYDFSKAKVRCSGIYYVVAPGKIKTPKQQYEYLHIVLSEEMQKYEDMGERKQGMANGLKKASKISGLEYEISKLEPKKNEDPLSASAKSYLKKLYAHLKYGKWSANKDKGNKYTQKGKLVQVDAIALMAKMDGYPYQNNEERIENEFISGIPDTFAGESLINAVHIPDVKASWDVDTFFDNIGKPLNPLYWWQEQGYFDLTGAKGGEVSYFLMDTPESFINDELFRLAKDMNVISTESQDPKFRKAAEELINNMTFSNTMSDNERRLKFEIKRDDIAIKKVHEAVPKCRDFLFELQEMHLMGVFSDQELILEPVEELV